jgi:hypothetical protein
MGTELPTKVMLGQTLVLMQMTFLNNGRKVGRLVLSRIYFLYENNQINPEPNGTSVRHLVTFIFTTE